VPVISLLAVGAAHKNKEFNYYYYHHHRAAVVLLSHVLFCPGTSRLEPMVNPTTQTSSLRQYYV
jgi:hypothetical protein